MTRATTNVANAAKKPIHIEPVIPRTKYPTADTPAAINAYGSCVNTWSIWCDPAPVELRIVVSEIGEQWSPNTAPASTAASVGSNSSGSTAIIKSAPIGSMRPNVPQLVPVENAIRPAIANKMSGK